MIEHFKTASKNVAALGTLNLMQKEVRSPNNAASCRHYSQQQKIDNFMETVRANQIKSKDIITEYKPIQLKSKDRQNVNDALQTYLNSKKQPEDLQKYKSVKNKLNVR